MSHFISVVSVRLFTVGGSPCGHMSPPGPGPAPPTPAYLGTTPPRPISEQGWGRGDTLSCDLSHDARDVPTPPPPHFPNREFGSPFLQTGKHSQKYLKCFYTANLPSTKSKKIIMTCNLKQKKFICCFINVMNIFCHS